MTTTIRTSSLYFDFGLLLRWCLAGALLGLWPDARAEVVRSNYVAAGSLWIMPMGDSITDDCEVEGAWREPLQPLLQSDGLPFRFIGREESSYTAGQAFTQIFHEGYCGAVIAAPGVSMPTRIYTLQENYLQYILPGALSNKIPNILLILIGANDIGRGRDPIHTATVDMPNLLSEMWAQAPNCNVILSKITTLSNATLLDYGEFATNVPIYNAALMSVVNQYQAEGSNVYLADLFSQVNYNTMFMSDHLHPNSNGLAAIAQEFSTRIQSILTGTNRVTTSLIHCGDAWKYSDTGTDLGSNWSQPGYDDSPWSSGVGRFGFGEIPDATIVSSGRATNSVNTTTYFRKTIVVPWNVDVTNLNFRLTQTAGAVVWLNGHEAYRTNLPPGPIAYTNLATAELSGDPEYIYYQSNLAQTLTPGTNLIAVEVHQNSTNSPVLGFDMELLAGAFVVPPPTLSPNLAGPARLALSWPLTNGVAFSLYSSSQANGTHWQPAAAAYQTNGGTITGTLSPGVSPSFYRLQFQP